MKKRIVSVLLCIVMVLALMPTAVFAVTEYPVWVGGVQVTSLNKDDILGDGKVSFDPEKLVLRFMDSTTLTNTHYESGAIIYARMDHVGAVLTIIAPTTGDGLKLINSNAAGILVNSGSVSITGKITIDTSFHCITASYDIVLSGSGDVNLTSDMDGIAAMQNAVVSGSGKLTINSGSEGIYGGEYISLSKTGDVTITAGRNGISSRGLSVLSCDGAVTINSHEFGIYGDHVKISGSGDIRITSDSAGIAADADAMISGSGDLHIEPATVGISARGDIEIAGSRSIHIVSDGADGIRASKKATLSGSGAVEITGAGLAILATEDIVLSGDGPVKITASSGINTYAALTVSGGSDVSVQADELGIVSYGNAVFSGSGNVEITSEKTALTAAGKAEVSGTGDLTVNSNEYGVYVSGGSLILSGTGAVSIFGKDTGVRIWGAESKVLLEGTANPVTLKSAKGKAVYNSDTGKSPVAGRNYADYTAAGSPASSSVVYTLKNEVKDITITGLDKPVVGGHPDTTITITNSRGFKLTGTAKWLEYDSTTPKVMSASDVFKAGVKYTCLITVSTADGCPFKYSVELGSHSELYVIYAGTFTVNGEALDGKKGTLSDNLLSLRMRWWDKEPVTADCGGDPGVCALTPFTDVPKYTNWAHKGIEYCVINGLMNGTTATTFEPKTAMSRAMLVTVLYRMEGQPGAGSTTFTDVPAGKWFSAAVSWAADHGIVTGMGDGKFNPNGNVTREQIATILYRYSSYKGYNTSNKDSLSGFADASKVGKWFVDGMQWAVAEGLINGTLIQNQTCLTPQGDATREQVAAILMRFCENVAN